ncbi:MAG TPA: glycosyltransferase family 1 protein [Bryobacteraceae bacterium]|nr:glycosyltransferase family 1 protein [Bryobacteraceae bacterium]
MRIVIDASSLLGRSAGVKTHVYYWIRSLQNVAGSDEVRLFPFVPDCGRLDHEHSAMGRWRTLASLLFLRFANADSNPVLELVLARADVFHASQHVHNPPWRLPRLTATIFDMTCWLTPEWHVRANVEATKAYADRVLRRAAGCLANSNSARQDAIEILGLDPDRVTTVYPGVAEEFFSVTPEIATDARRKYGLQKPYAFFLGMLEPRKNLDGLLTAFEQLPTGLRSEIELVIAGPVGWCHPDTLRRLSPPPAGVRYLGYVPEEDIPGLTAGALMFVFPSFYEGFGLPVVQALAAGVPVITSLGSSLEEVAGDAAILVDPKRPDEIAAAIERLALSPCLQEDLRARGRIRAERFHWESCAKETLEFFHRVARG